MKKIAIIGPYPPPFGGISVHIQRLLEYLPRESYLLFNESNTPVPGQISFNGKIRQLIKVFIFLFKSFKLIHHHTPSNKMRALLCFIAFFRKNIYLHVHGVSMESALNSKGLLGLILRNCLRNVYIIADNPDIAEQVLKYRPREICQIDAFIPPKYNEQVYNEFNETVEIPDAEIIVCMMGWFKRNNNEDLYGFDIALEALQVLINEYHLDIAVTASVNGITDRDIYAGFLKKRENYSLSKKFQLILDPLPEIWPLYLNSHIFIRPSNTDGNALSIKEALWFECKVVASDAVIRPEGTRLHKNRDAYDLANKILEITKEKIIPLEARIEIIKNKKFQNKLIKDIYGLEN